MGLMDQIISIDDYERLSRDWDYKFSWLPKRCMQTNKSIWLTYAYRGRSKHHHLFEQDDMWLCSEEFIILRLMDKV